MPFFVYATAKLGINVVKKEVDFQFQVIKA